MEILNNVLLTAFCVIAFVCWAAIFVYGIIKLTKTK